jgi:hypothetical protein
MRPLPFGQSWSPDLRKAQILQIKQKAHFGDGYTKGILDCILGFAT